MAYISAADLQAYIFNERPGVDGALLTSAVNAAQKSIDHYCGRKFTVAAGSSARSFVPTESETLEIWDCTAVSAITEDGVALSSSAYQLEPVGGFDVVGNTVPYNLIRRIDNLYWRMSTATPGKATISVTATWGWAAVPDEVPEASRMIGKEIVDERYNRGGLAIIGDIAARAVRSRGVAELLDPLRNHRGFSSVLVG